MHPARQVRFPSPNFEVKIVLSVALFIRSFDTLLQVCSVRVHVGIRESLEGLQDHHQTARH
jgi:hypothetical protein